MNTPTVQTKAICQTRVLGEAETLKKQHIDACLELFDAEQVGLDRPDLRAKVSNLEARWFEARRCDF